MEQSEKFEEQTGMLQNKENCGCEGDCCPPKKNNLFTKIIFVVILVAAMSIIGVKVFNKPVVQASKTECCPSASTSCCDTAKDAGCDSTKDSSCCPKK